MRKALVALVAAAVVAVALPASADHRPNTYCSESGDICLSTKKIDGVRKFRLGMAAKYFDSYKLCVIGPNGEKTCHNYEVQKIEGGVYGDVVRWKGNFPNEGSGAYDVVWKQGGSRLGDRLGFHK